MVAIALVATMVLSVGSSVDGSSARPLGAGRSGTVPDPRPNILLIVTDDQRFASDTLPVMPSVARLFMDEGRRYPRAIVTTPLCCPSRSSILTGRYAHNTGVLTNGNEADVLAFDQRTTLEARLHEVGYRTAIAGKLFNTWPLTRSPDYFDRFALLTGGYQDPVFNVDGAVRRASGYSTDLIADHAIDFLRGFDAAADDDPWFLYMAPHAPHSPYEPASRFADAALPAWEPPPASRERNRGDKPPWVRWRDFTPREADDLRSAQLRTLMSVDELVSRVFEELDSLGESNTLAIFTSDNGYLWGEHGIGRDKRFPYLGSVRVPLLLRWPGHVPAGSVDRGLVANVDIAPTILSSADVTVDPMFLDGRSLLGDRDRSRLLMEYWRSPDAPFLPTWKALRRRSSVYVEWYDDGRNVIFREFYDLGSDPNELRNLLGDGTDSNDPNVHRLSAALGVLSACSGPACP
jgi:arylsulfatase A-like enzyme